MIRCSQVFSDGEQVRTLATRLSWSHFTELLPLDRPLCASRNAEQVELLELDDSGIHIAEYLTVLPPRDVLEERLRASYRAAERAIADTPQE